MNNELNNIQTYQKQPDEIFCSSCGKPIKKEAEICVYCGVRQINNSNEKSEKNWTTCLLLCIFLGTFGGHRFYAGRIASAIMILLFTVVVMPILSIVSLFLLAPFLLIALGIIWIIDIIIIATGNLKDSNNKYIKN